MPVKQFLKPPLLKLLWFLGPSIGPWFDRPLRRERVSRILVFQGGGVGDLVRAFPAVRRLRAAFPHASIAVLSQFGDRLFRLFPGPAIISEHILYDLQSTHRGLPGKLRLIRSLRRRRFDLIFSPNYGLGMMEAMIITFLIGATYRIGFDREGAGFLYTTKRELRVAGSILEQNLELLGEAGLPAGDPGAYVRVPEEDLAFARSALEQEGVRHDDLLIAIAPDVKTEARYQSFPEYRAWPAERYAELIRELPRRFGANVLLLGGGAPSPPGGQSAASPRQPRMLDLRGRTSLVQAAGLIACADVFVGNDSGLLHIAMGLGTPCVAIFGATTPQQVIPPSDRCIALWKNLPCSPCFSHQPLFDLVCPYQIECLRSVTVDEVLQAVERLLPAGPRPGCGLA